MSRQPISLRPLEATELEAFIRLTIAGYADDRAAAVNARAEDTQRNARNQVEALLPQGLATPDHHLYTVVEGDAAVGHLWLAVTDVDGFRSVVVYDIQLREDARGRGVGRRVMDLAEDVARGLGARDLELHVFAHNTRARRLYETLGYQTTSLCMRKTIEPS
ncbi:N-acetyltransferase family protein [Sorangium sp. So ce1153]|uniref:GNAT family N-acetyltransferase n=1 Tax=Sorangium sp. So ce1153 TaxID=3133333 RepID=UPI003F62EB62